QELIQNIADLEYVVVNSEFEALLLEARLIKQHEPKYNIAQKDSKSYLYIIIGKEFPNRVFLARLSQLKQEVLDWYGPFPSSSEARQILKFVRRIFPFRSCKKLPKSPCLYYHLHLCPGVCKINEHRTLNYEQCIQKIRKLLSGKANSLKTIIKALEKEMKACAKATDFEKAQVIKNQIDSLKRLAENGWRAVPKEKQENSKALLELRKILKKYQGNDPTVINRIEGYDVSNLGKNIIVGSMVAFIDSEPDKSQYRKFNLKYNLTGQDDPEGIKQIISRRLNHPEWVYPQLILVDGGKTQLTAAFEAIKKKALEKHIALLGITKEEELMIIPKIASQKIIAFKTLRLSRHSPVLQLLQAIRDESHRFAQRYYRQLHLKTSLGQ
ncbi:MAG: UvrB/UvrC motif-containing protein, partial [Microgenomates group bacterium]